MAWGLERRESEQESERGIERVCLCVRVCKCKGESARVCECETSTSR